MIPKMWSSIQIYLTKYLNLLNIKLQIIESELNFLVIKYKIKILKEYKMKNFSDSVSTNTHGPN